MTGAATDAPTALLDAHHLGEHQTGNETWARNVVRALEADGGAAVHYAVTRRGAADLPSPVDGERLHLVSGSSVRRLLVDVPRIVRRLHPDVLLAQYTLPATHVPGAVAIHDLSFEDPDAASWIPPLSLRRYRTTIRSSARRARCVIVGTEWTKADLLARYDVNPDRVVLCPSVVDAALLASLSAVAAARLELPAMEPTVLCIGGVLPRKNLPVVARAVLALRDGGLAATLRVVGGVPAAGKPDAALLIELLGEAVSFAGYVTPDQLAQEYRSAAVLAYASRHEGFGIPLLEGMAAGIPVVSSNATSLPEVGGDAPLYAGPDDVEGWRTALGRVLSEPALRASMVGRGALRVAAYRQQDIAPAVRRAFAVAVG